MLPLPPKVGRGGVNWLDAKNGALHHPAACAADLPSRGGEVNRLRNEPHWLRNMPHWSEAEPR